MTFTQSIGHPLDEESARRRDLYLTKHTIHKRHAFMPPVGFEPAIPASERLQTHAWNRAATGIGLSANSWAMLRVIAAREVSYMKNSSNSFLLQIYQFQTLKSLTSDNG